MQYLTSVPFVRLIPVVRYLHGHNAYEDSCAWRQRILKWKWMIDFTPFQKIINSTVICFCKLIGKKTDQRNSGLEASVCLFAILPAHFNFQKTIAVRV